MSSSSPSSSSGLKLNQRLKIISDVEQRIGELIKHAQACISELSKEKQISKTKMEEHSSAFKKCLNSIETDLNAQMQYLSHVCVGTAHQGTTFASQQRIMLAERSFDSLMDHLKYINETHMPDTGDDSAME
uniref:Mediator of RNA polymerase II transcription subunit 11 n=1 Tax=Syphacia muris TaxID=451379 RepID=A0A0N5AK98_9BILA